MWDKEARYEWGSNNEHIACESVRDKTQSGPSLQHTFIFLQTSQGPQNNQPSAGKKQTGKKEQRN